MGTIKICKRTGRNHLIRCALHGGAQGTIGGKLITSSTFYRLDYLSRDVYIAAISPAID